MRQPLRKIAAHYIFRGGMLVPDAVLTVALDGTLDNIEYSRRRDGMCGVEFYSGILMCGMVLPSVDWTACRDREFVSARLWCDGVQATGEMCGDEPVCMEALTRTHTVNLLMERYGADLLPFADAVTRRGALLSGRSGECGDLTVSTRCGVVLLSGVDYSSLRLTDAAATVRIV